MLAFAIYISHGLACYVAADIVYNKKLRSRVSRNKLLWEYVSRLIIVLITCEFRDTVDSLRKTAGYNPVVYSSSDF